jgi:hypothetical protein
MADYPGYGFGNRSSPGGDDRSGTGGGNDPTTEPGQYPPADDHGIFGGPLPTGTGAPGTAGGHGASDPTVEAGQLTEDFTGVPARDVTDTNAPGSGGASASDGAGPDAVDFTRAGSYLSGTYTSDTVRDSIDGAGNWTEANDSGYGTDGPKLPGMAEPKAGQGPYQPGGGRVLRGGRAVRG